MYINFELAKTKGLTPTDVVNLQLISQNKTENLEGIIFDNIPLRILHSYQEQELVTLIKAKNKSESIHNRVRLTPKGHALLEDLQVPEVNEDDLRIFEWVKSIYIKEGKEIGNEKRTKMYIAQFSKESGITQNSLAFLIKTFLSDEKEFTYSQKMQYLFFKGESLFSTRFDISSSRLFQYYQKNKNLFDTKFKQFEE
jgi:DNA-binding PadR family transcriptional regulator